MSLAAEWLEIYEGAEDAEACHRVAAWLKQQSDAADFRNACKSAGVSVAHAKRVVAKRAALAKADAA